MDPVIQRAISGFFEAASALRTFGVIRSDKYLGDIAEFICCQFYDITLATSGRQVGFDGTDKDGPVQVKFHGSVTRTNINLGNPDHYNHVYVVLGPVSLLRSHANTGDFLIYRISSDIVRKCQQAANGTYSCGKSLFERPSDKTLTLQATKALIENGTS